MTDQLPPQENVPSTPTSQRPSRHPVFAVVAVLLVVILCALAFWVGMRWAGQQERGADQTEETDETEGTEDEEVVGEDGLVIDWLPTSQQERMDYDTAFAEVVPPFAGDLAMIDLELRKPEYQPRAFKLGSVEGGDYDGYDLTMQVSVGSGMGVWYVYHYVLIDPTGERASVLLPRYAFTYQFSALAYPLGEGDAANLAATEDVELNTELRIPEFEREEISYDSEGHSFVHIGDGQRVNFPLRFVDGQNIDFPVASYPVVATLEDGTQLREFREESVPGVVAIRNAFFALREDNRLEWFDIQIPFWDGITNAAPDRSVGVPNVYLNTYKNTAAYMKGSLGGCGFSSVTNVRLEKDLPELEVVGYYVEGERVDLYAPTDYSLAYYQETFNRWLLLNPSGTMEQFMALTPYFYWQDSFGRWIEFMRADLAPAVECGKPVIYLYPEETTDLTVTLNPKGGFSVTEPVYNDGWRVTAHPDGALINRDDGKTYPYLFWEGRGGLYAEPTRYWVVAKGDVHTFLVETLAQLGLNEKETADFLEFWEPRMQAAPYYKIGFYGNRVMDQIAPLTISQKPETVVRVLMDYQELQAPIPANPPVLPPTPQRKGFTVIEWGGVLR